MTFRLVARRVRSLLVGVGPLAAIVLVSGSMGAQAPCAPPDHDNMQGLVAELRYAMVKPRLFPRNARLGLPQVDSLAVEPVVSDSVCLLAAGMLNRILGVPDTTRRTMHVVRVGSVYWMEDPTVKAGEYIRAFVVDSTFTTILSRPGR